MGHAARKGNELPIARGIQPDGSCLPSRNTTERDGLTWVGVQLLYPLSKVQNSQSKTNEALMQ